MSDGEVEQDHLNDTEKSEKIEVKLTERQKQRWKDAAGAEYGTISSLVRSAVNRELNEQYTHVNFSNNANVELNTDGIEQQLTDLTTEVRNLHARLDQMDAGEAIGGRDDEQVMEVAMLAQDCLAHVESEEGLNDLVGTVAPTMTVENQAALEATTEAIAAAIDKPEDSVRQALIYLEKETTEPVESTIIDGTRRWYIIK